jgi:CheY-like chemotaxis protein
MYPNDRILVVEDDVDHYTLIVEGFARARVSNQLVRAATAGEALSFLKGEGTFANRELHPLPCLILLDLNLPDERGFAVLEWVRSNPELRKLPIIVLTVSSADEDLQEAYRLGANSYLVKPFKVEEFRTLIKSINAYWVLLAEKPRM